MSSHLKHPHDSYTNSPSNDTPAPIAGGGYSTDGQMPTFLQCLKEYNSTFVGGGKSVVYFSDSISFNELQRALNIEVDEKASIGIFSEDASANYARHIQDDNYTQSFYYAETINLPTKVIQIEDYGTDALGNIGKSVYAQGPNKFREVCGDQVIKQLGLGAGLYVTLRIEFHTHSDKETFSSNIDVTLGDLGSASSSISSVISKYNLQANLELSALQIGGDITQIAKIFNNSCGDHYCITSCSFSNLSACQGIIDGVITYAMNNFPQQIDFQDGKVLGSAEITSYTYMPFTVLGLDVGPSILNSTIIDARAKLGETYTTYNIYATQIEHVLKDLPISNVLDINTKQALEQEQVNVNANLALLQDPNNGGIACYIDPITCPDVANTILSNLKPLQPSLLDQFKSGYNCRMYDISLGLFNDPTQCLPIGNNKMAVTFFGTQFIYTMFNDVGSNLVFNVNGQNCTAVPTGMNVYSANSICHQCPDAVPPLQYPAPDHKPIVCFDCPYGVRGCDEFDIVMSPIQLDWI